MEYSAQFSHCESEDTIINPTEGGQKTTLLPYSYMALLTSTILKSYLHYNSSENIS